MRIRIATRKSELALWQARHAADRLRGLSGVTAVDLVPLSTRGDRILDRELADIGGKGLFIKELETALQEGAADIAVHSMKDVPAEMPAGFRIGAVLERGNPFDALVSTQARTLASLPRGAVVGSSSLRRQAQLRALRPDIEMQPLRGNVNTRLGKLDNGEFDAIVLACAGLQRLGLGQRISEEFAPDRMLPASSQGVIGIECASGRHDLDELLALLNHPATEATTVAERSVAACLEASCHSPLASFAVLEQDVLTLTALVASVDGKSILRRQVSGTAGEAAQLGSRVGRMLLDLGADKLLGEAAG